MAFVNASLLAGALFVAIPIALHLIMRRRPRRVVFPALRFVRAKREANRKKLRLRHLLLLAFRCAAIGLLAFALARPSLKGSGAFGKDSGPLAAAFVFDNSARMEYQFENASRLAVARDLASGLLQRLPEDTLVAVSALSGGRLAFADDLGAAQQRVARLQPSAVTRSLADAVADAVRLLAEDTERRQELFVFTDMSAAAWSPSALESINDAFKGAPRIALYVVDVGAPNPENFGLGPIRFSDQVIAPETPLKIRAPLIRSGPETERPVELFLSETGEPETKRGRQNAVWSADSPGEIEFEITGLDYGTHQGSLRVVGEDPLAPDDARFFTLEVLPPRPILLVANAARDAVFVESALSTTGRFETRFEPFTRLTSTTLEDYAAVFVLDPPALPTAAWEALLEFVKNGGGVAICLGHQAERDAFNAPTPQELLAGKLEFRSRSGTYLSPRAFEHPIVSKFRPYASETPWRQFPVDKFWDLDSLAADASVVMHYANGRPAILVRPVGMGEVVTMTTPLSDPAYLPEREVWNLLPTGLSTDAWPFWLLVNEMAAYMTGGSGDTVNYLAGEPVAIHLAPNERRAIQDAGGFAIIPPSGEGVRRNIPPGQDAVQLTAPDEIGNYRVAAGGKSGALKRGFSVDLPATVSDLERASQDAIANTLEPVSVRFASSAEEIEVKVGLGRVGRELYVWLMGLVAVALAAEFVLANRFYRDDV